MSIGSAEGGRLFPVPVFWVRVCSVEWFLAEVAHAELSLYTSVGNEFVFKHKIANELGKLLVLVVVLGCFGYSRLLFLFKLKTPKKACPVKFYKLKVVYMDSNLRIWTVLKTHESTIYIF